MDTASGRTYWVSVEGIDGAGKSTLIRRLANGRIAPSDLEIRLLPEISGSRVGELIQRLIAETRFVRLEAEHPTSMAETALLASDQLFRIEGLESDNRNVLFLSDRGPDSRIAYQTAAIERDYPGLERSLIMEWVAGMFALSKRPDVTVLLRPPIEECLRRCASRANQDEPPISTAESVEYLRDCDRVFAELASREPNRFLVVEGVLDLDDSYSRVESFLKTVLLTGG